MDSGRENLLHLHLHIDELEPRGGILELLRRLRPQWKPQDIHMKVNAGPPANLTYFRGQAAPLSISVCPAASVTFSLTSNTDHQQPDGF